MTTKTMHYTDLKDKLRRIVNTSGSKLEIRGRNFMTPNFIGYRNGVEITYGEGISGGWIIGVTFTTDHKHPAHENNKCFHEDEMSQIKKYIDEKTKKAVPE